MNSIRIEDWKTSNLQIIIYQSLDLNTYWFTTSARTSIYLVNNRTNSWHMARRAYKFKVSLNAKFRKY